MRGANDDNRRTTLSHVGGERYKGCPAPLLSRDRSFRLGPHRRMLSPRRDPRPGAVQSTVAEFIPWASKLLPQYQSTTHLSGGQTVLQVSGDTAWAEHYVRAYHRTAPSATEPATEWIINLRYIDRMSCRNDEWRIAHRQCVCESQRVDVLDSAGAELGPEWARGRRDHTDPSYRRD